MAKTKQQKNETMEKLVSNMKSAPSVVFANYQGLKMKDSVELRNKCREAGVLYIASKKTLINKALVEAGISGIDVKGFEGAVAAVFASKDEVAPAQLLADFAKKHDMVKMFGGVLEGAFINSEKVNALSKLPSKQQLLGQLVGTLNAPVSGFVNVLAGNLRGLVNVLNAIKDKGAV